MSTQPELFPKPVSTYPERDPQQFMWDQLAKLGDMMGDGLHHEPDGKWITREYKRLFKILCPEHAKEQRKMKAANINVQMMTLLMLKKCSCGGTLKQSRSGSKISYCADCNNRYKARTIKKPKT